MKLYQKVELGGSGARFSVAQANTAQRKGCTTGGYVWLYAGIDGAKQVADAIDTASQAQLPLNERNPLWLDCEDYTDNSYPSLAVIRQAVAECQRRGITVGIYTGGWWWKSRAANSQEFTALPLWAAVYDGNPALIAPGFGGWTEMAGHQWSGNPVDRSVFRADFATP